MFAQLGVGWLPLHMCKSDCLEFVCFLVDVVSVDVLSDLLLNPLHCHVVSSWVCCIEPKSKRWFFVSCLRPCQPCIAQFTADDLKMYFLYPVTSCFFEITQYSYLSCYIGVWAIALFATLAELSGLSFHTRREVGSFPDHDEFTDMGWAGIPGHLV